MIWDVLTGVGTLALMVLVFAGAYWASRFLAARYQGTSGKVGSLRVLEQTVLGKDSKLMLVQVDEKVYLLGVGAQSVTLLDSFPAQERPPLQPPGAPPSFRDVLRNIREKGGGASE